MSRSVPAARPAAAEPPSAIGARAATPFGGRDPVPAGTPGRSADLVRRYGAALALVLLATLATAVVQPLIETWTVNVYIVAVLLAAWYGGLGPGILATVASALTLSFYFVPPVMTLALKSASDAIRLGLFTAAGGIGTWVCHLLRVARRAAEAHADRAERHARQIEAGAAALAESEARFRRLVEGVTDHAIFGLDPDGRIVTWNAGAERIIGYPASEILGRSYATFFAPEEVGAGLPGQLLAAAARDGHAVDEGWRVRRDGTRFWAGASITALRDEHGALLGFSKITRDLTERRAAEAALAASEARLGGIIRSAMDAIVTTDAAQRIVLFNAAAERVFGLPQAEALGQPLDRFIPTRFRAGHRAQVEAFGRSDTATRAMGGIGHGSEGTGEGAWGPTGAAAPHVAGTQRPGEAPRAAVLALRADGTEFPIEAAISHVRTAEGIFYTVILRDVSARLEAEAALREAEQHARLALEAAELGTFAWDVAADRHTWDTRTRAIYGLSDDERMSFARLEQLVHPDDRLAPSQQAFPHPAPGERVARHRARFRIVRPDGAIRAIEVHGRVEYDVAPDGALVLARVVGTVEDATARVRAVQRTRQLQALAAHLAVSSTPDAVAQVGVEAVAAAMREAVGDAGSLGGGGLAGVSIALVVEDPLPTDAPDATRDGPFAGQFVASIGYPESEVTRWRRFPLDLATPFGDAIASGAPVAIGSWAEWETRYPHLRESARAAGHERLLALPLRREHGDLAAAPSADGGAASAPAGLLAMASGGRSAHRNAHRDAAPGGPDASRTPSRAASRATRGLPRAVGVLGVGFRGGVHLEADDAAYLDTMVDLIAGALERARLYQRAEAERRAADRANAAKSTFLATMSHEIRTPINATLGYLQLLDLGVAGELVPMQREYVGRAQAANHQLLHIINEVLDLAKVESGQLAVARARHTLGPPVSDALAVVRPQAAARGLVLDAPAALLGSDGPPFLGDADRVRQIVVNLLANAIKFTEPPGRVAVASGRIDVAPSATDEPGSDGEAAAAAAGEAGPSSVTPRPEPSPAGPPRAGAWVYVRVTDTGIGIAADQLARIFEPFVQVEADNEDGGIYRRSKGGTGLGLAISRRLARLMGGELTVESTPGVGSAFTLWLPAPEATLPRIGDGTSGELAGSPVGRPAGAQGTTTASGMAATTAGVAAGDPAAGAEVVARALTAGPVGTVVRRLVDRLRQDPEVPLARHASVAELADHTAALLTNLAQQLDVWAQAGAEGAGLDVPDGAMRRASSGEAAGDDPPARTLLRDGHAIQHVIAARHGAQRARLGWDERALRREFALLTELLVEVLTDPRSATRPETPGGAAAEQALTAARDTLRDALRAAERVCVDGFRAARADAHRSAPGAEGAPDAHR